MKKLIMLLFLISLSFAQLDNLTITQAGACKDFTIKINSDLKGCWDVKIDAPGHIITEEGPKDMFFYINNAICNGSAELKTKFSTPNDINAVIKLRQNNAILEKDFFVDQNCPAELSNEMTFAVAIIIIIILLEAALWYARRK